MITLYDLAEKINAEVFALEASGVLTEAVCAITGNEALQISDVHHDSSKVTEGSVFACIPGEISDGHNYAEEAIKAGAVALLAQQPHLNTAVSRQGQGTSASCQGAVSRQSASAAASVLNRAAIPVMLVDSVRETVGLAAAAVHGYPSTNVNLVGVTGTNGKTTTVRLIAHLLTARGFGADEIGTLTSKLTTPEASDLQRSIASAERRGQCAVAMEVSSHALQQHRVNGCEFAVAVFLNLGRDHLDYHNTLEAYFQAKERLFTDFAVGKAVINVDDCWGARLAEAVNGRMPLVKVSSANFNLISMDCRHSSFMWRSELIYLPLVGMYNVFNAVIAAETAILLGLTPRFIAQVIADIPQIPGRFETLETDQGFQVIVDYAHTPDALASLLRAVRQVAGGRIILVVGAGGDRDRGKREAIGEAAETFADKVIVTSDNPRTEDPQKIVDEIVSGMRSKPELVEVDRRCAIRDALRMAVSSDSSLSDASSSDVVVIAGKGHEHIQMVGADAFKFNDMNVVREELKMLGALADMGTASDTALSDVALSDVGAA